MIAMINTPVTFSTSTFVIASVLTPYITPEVSILVAAIFVGLVNMYVARTARLIALKEVTKQIAPVVAQMDTIKPVVDKIEAHVNSEKTRAEGESVTLKKQIELQREMIDELKKAAALLAQARATSELTQVVAKVAAMPSPAPSSESAESSLLKIDENTAAIEKNTATTKADVQDLKESV